MHFSSALLLAVGAASVSAHPSGHHAHMHRAVHEQQQKRDGTIVVATIDGKVVSWTQGGSPFKAAYKPTTSSTLATSTTTPAAVVATSSSSAAAVIHGAASSSSSSSSTAVAATSSTASSSGSSGSGISTYEAFATCSSDKKKRATTAEIAYTGNTGCDGYGSNIKLIQSNLASDYSYTVKAVNSGSSAMECVVWNKIGSDGGIDGFFTGNQALTFTLAASSSQYLAFDSNTQGGMCCQSGSVSTTSYGEFLCPWLEFDFADAANSDWSGFDASALVEGSAGGPYGALEVCTSDGATCSTLNEGGGGTNAYLPGDEALDGIGGNLPAGDVALIATW